MTIKFNNIVMFGYHGVFEEEKILGNNFILNIKIEIADKKDSAINSLDDVVDYAKVFNLIYTNFNRREDLLEKVMHNIAQDIMDKNPLVLSLSIEIAKEKMYLPHFNGTISVKQKFSRNEQ